MLGCRTWMGACCKGCSTRVSAGPKGLTHRGAGAGAGPGPDTVKPNKCFFGLAVVLPTERRDWEMAGFVALVNTPGVNTNGAIMEH